MSRAIRVKDLKGKNLLSKEEREGLRGNVVILNHEKSEIAKHLKAEEEGSYSIKT